MGAFCGTSRGGMMPDFDDDEYESFDLEDSGDDSDPDSDAEVDAVDLDGTEDDDLDDAAPDEIDFALAAYREDGQPMVQALATDLANDLDELIVQLRRLPGDAGAVGFVSLVEEVFVIARVRAQHAKLRLSDGGAQTEGPKARNVANRLARKT